MTALEVPSRLLSSIYEAAEEPQSWPDAVEAMTHWVGGAAGALQARPSDPRTVPLMVLSGLDPHYQKAYAEHHVASDPHVARFATLPVGKALLSCEVLSEPELKKTAYYNEFCRPQKLQDLQGIIVLRTEQWVASFATLGARGVEFGAESLARLGALAPHLRRALLFSARIDAQASAPSFTELPRSLQPIARCLARGLSDKDIASALGLSLPTARTYVTRTMRHLGVSNRRELMAR